MAFLAAPAVFFAVVPVALADDFVVDMYLNGKPIPADNVQVGLHLPMGRNGPAFLTYPNFDIYLEWNKSLVYTTTAAYYATRLAGGPALNKGNGPVEALGLAETKLIQQLLAKRGFEVGKIDGVLGRCGMGQVMRAHDLVSDQPVALKRFAMPLDELDAQLRYIEYGDVEVEPQQLVPRLDGRLLELDGDDKTPVRP